MTTTHLDGREVMLGDNRAIDALLSFSGEDTFVRGTLLGRLVTSASSYAGTPTGDGDRVTTLTALAGHTLQLGTYTLVFGDLTAGAGPATLNAPDGSFESITVTASGDQVFAQLGVNVNIAASGTAYDDDDEVAFVVAGASGKPTFVPFAPAGSNGAQVISGVLVDDVSRSNAGTELIRPVIAGRVNRRLLVIDADGDGDDITLAQLEQMRVYGLYAVDTFELGQFDN